jgi:uncharacterized membrane protein YbhN (UPF0104 family)
VRKDRVDPEAWADKLAEFRLLAGRQLRRAWLPGSLLMLVTVAITGAMLVLSLRFVGLPSSAVTTAQLMGVFLVVYPLTALPFAGLGVLDAFYYQAVVGAAGEQYASTAVAGLVVWRTATLVAPLVVGAFVYPAWRRSHPHVPEATPDEIADDVLDT